MWMWAQWLFLGGTTILFPPQQKKKRQRCPATLYSSSSRYIVPKEKNNFKWNALTKIPIQNRSLRFIIAAYTIQHVMLVSGYILMLKRINIILLRSSQIPCHIGPHLPVAASERASLARSQQTEADFIKCSVHRNLSKKYQDELFLNGNLSVNCFHLINNHSANL